MKEKFYKIKQLKSIIDRVCVGSTTTWTDRILLKAIKDDEYYDLCIKIFGNLMDMSSKEIDSCFEYLNSLAIQTVENYNDDITLEQKYETILNIESYFGIIEQIDEMSTLSENLYKNIVNKIGYDNFRKIEQDNPSELTNLSVNKGIQYEDEEINKYLVLKKWQDKQNVFFEEKVLNKIDVDKIEYEISKLLQKIKVKSTMRRKYEFYQLLHQLPIEIEKLSELYVLNILQDFKDLIGGKAYGLAILNCFTEIPESFVLPYCAREEKECVLDKICENKTYAVRSSANCEDNEKHSFAGMFDSYLNVKKEEVLNKIDLVFDSVNNLKVKNYIEINNLQEPKMNVIIQEFISPDFAGVWMSNDIESGIYELVQGVGDNLVSGKVTPTIHNFDKNDVIASQLVNLQKDIESKCDFEFCLKNDKLYLLQCRPITTNIKKEIVQNDGVGASFGECEAEVCFLEDYNDCDKFKEGAILVTYATDPNWLPAIVKSKGIVTLYGGYLCHTAIISRELNIPCVVGASFELFEKVRKAKRIKINGFDGKIEILE